MKLVVGLGNPGAKYSATRHNAGFWWVGQLADASRCTLKPNARFHGLAGTLDTRAGDVWLLLPETFMNDSGRAVVALALFYKILPQQILVVHDELDLQPGTVKLKLGGGTAGHNGLKSIAAHLGTKDFWRLRLGIGHPGDRGAVIDYVLHKPASAERELIDAAIERSLGLWPLMAEDRMEDAMLRLHTKPVRSEG
jgi:PTH1 family peptidyl-tRNA hydrolase